MDITIIGDRLTQLGLSCRIGANSGPALDATAVTSTDMLCSAPSLAAGTYTVSVTNDDVIFYPVPVSLTVLGTLDDFVVVMVLVIMYLFTDVVLIVNRGVRSSCPVIRCASEPTTLLRRHTHADRVRHVTVPAILCAGHWCWCPAVWRALG